MSSAEVHRDQRTGPNGTANNHGYGRAVSTGPKRHFRTLGVNYTIELSSAFGKTGETEAFGLWLWNLHFRG
jgi:hypothetical protein